MGRPPVGDGSRWPGGHTHKAWLSCRRACGAHLAVDPHVGTVARACTSDSMAAIVRQRVGTRCSAYGSHCVSGLPCRHGCRRMHVFCHQVYGYTRSCMRGPLSGSHVGMVASACIAFCIRVYGYTHLSSMRGPFCGSHVGMVAGACILMCPLGSGSCFGANGLPISTGPL